MATIDRHGIDHGPFYVRKCKDLSLGTLSAIEKRWLGGEQITQRTATAAELSKRHNLPTSQQYNYSRKGRKLRDSNGRPSLLDSIGKAELVEELVQKKAKSEPEVKVHLKERILQKVRESDIRAGNNGLKFDISRTTIAQIQHDLSIGVLVPQKTMTARYDAENDIRIFFVEAVMEEAHMNVCDSSLILDMDSTNFAVFGAGLVVKVFAVRNKSD